MPHTKRKQLTLFLDENQSQAIETIRLRFNPVQYSLIRSHLTLCREDEIGDLDKVLENLAQLKTGPFELELGELKRFSEGKGVLFEIKDVHGHFQNLRKGIIPQPRLHQPHLTLMHPRNSTCTDEIFLAIQRTAWPIALQFSRVSLIEQVNGQAWQVLQEFSLAE